MSQENIEIVRRWFGSFERGELPLDLTAEDVEIDNIKDFPVQGPYSGHEGVRRWWEDLAEAFESFRIELIDCAQVAEERVLTENRASGRFRGTGIPLDFRWASLISVRDGKVVRAVGHFSRRQALEAEGLRD